MMYWKHNFIYFKDISQTTIATLHYFSETKTDSLNPDIRNIDKAKTFCNYAEDKTLGHLQPTHVVSAITYGGDAHIEFRKVGDFYISFEGNQKHTIFRM